MNKVHDDEIDLRELVSIILNKKFNIIFFTAIFTIASILVSLSYRDIYQSTVTLMPVQEEDSLSTIGNYSSLVSLAGIDLSSNKSFRSEEAIERILSLKFFTESFLPFIKLEDLFAVEKWDKKSNKIIYDSDIFNDEKNLWMRPVNNLKSSKPSNQEAYKQYLKLIDITEDNPSSFKKISITHQSPFVAKQWLDLIINNINKTIRDIDKKRASDSIIFLNTRLNQTTYSELKTSLSELIQTQTKVLMLAESNKEYVFKVIDPAFVSEDKFKPARIYIVLLGTLMGLIISVLFFLASHFIKKQPK